MLYVVEHFLVALGWFVVVAFLVRFEGSRLYYKLTHDPKYTGSGPPSKQLLWCTLGIAIVVSLLAIAFLPFHISKLVALFALWSFSLGMIGYGSVVCVGACLMGRRWNAEQFCVQHAKAFWWVVWILSLLGVVFRILPWTG